MSLVRDVCADVVHRANPLELDNLWDIAGYRVKEITQRLASTWEKTIAGEAPRVSVSCDVELSHCDVALARSAVTDVHWRHGRRRRSRAR
jgi:hypothetical protein